MSYKLSISFILKECGTILGGEKDHPTNLSVVKERQILNEIEEVTKGW